MELNKTQLKALVRAAPGSPAVKKSEQREEIARLTQEYIDRGGLIKQVTCEDNQMARAPLKPTRRQQIRMINGRRHPR